MNNEKIVIAMRLMQIINKRYHEPISLLSRFKKCFITITLTKIYRLNNN